MSAGCFPGCNLHSWTSGWTRDAFLYVSDFFFEDQEDYDKVLEEAEAKAIKFDAESAQAPSAATPPAKSETQEAPPQVPAAPTATAQIAEAQPAKTPATDAPAVPAAGHAPASLLPRVKLGSPTSLSHVVAAGGIGGGSSASIARRNTGSPRARTAPRLRRLRFCRANPWRNTAVLCRSPKILPRLRRRTARSWNRLKAEISPR